MRSSHRCRLCKSKKLQDNYTMAILVLNCGSSSVKYQLFRIRLEDVIAQGTVTAIGTDESAISIKSGSHDKKTIKKPIQNHQSAITFILNQLTDPSSNILKDTREINIIGHRVVHGGEKFSGSVLITEETKKGIRDCFELAPLHNPHNMEGILACEKLIPEAKQVAVFDTAFHQTIPAYAYTYGIPKSLSLEHQIRRYGFHGTSHQYVSLRAAELLGKEFTQTNLISCHLGNGSSITAVNNGRSVDTSMGFTPLEGLVMGTRCGDIDPAIPLFLIHRIGMTPEKVDHLLNDSSGLKGISGCTNNMELLLAKQDSMPEARLAIDVFCYRVKKYIASYMGVLNKVDAVVFTAGIG
ncbi:MAG: acetate/propionate family kinase, partial [Elusimicrobia bacterium]|nr:acetate/propionate family kinase [Elusimicrobiota bacterium]MBD3411802.1 acetate/propionate family kinase [Elusimicrobiota bacterium]